MAGGLVFESCDWLRFVEFGSQREQVTDPLLSSLGVSPLRGGPAGRRARRDAPALGGLVGYLVSSMETVQGTRLYYMRGFRTRCQGPPPEASREEPQSSNVKEPFSMTPRGFNRC